MKKHMDIVSEAEQKLANLQKEKERVRPSEVDTLYNIIDTEP